MKRVVLHCDLNCFYASVEMLYHPEYRNVPMAVAGDPENRHGIILAKNVLAKKKGIKTGEAIWQARKKCPNLIVKCPDYDSYTYFSKKVRELYYEYTDLIEPFGLDECWLDITPSIKLFGSVQNIVNEILRRVKEEIGLTLSIGISDNKIYAKLGSDLAIEDNYCYINSIDDIKDLPANDLLNVGNSTYTTLKNYGIETIGDIANKTPTYLKSILGKWGEILYYFSNGYDLSEVKRFDAEEEVIKSIGNSMTSHRDLYDIDDIKTILQVLCDSVASRLKDAGMYYKTVHMNVRDNKLQCRTMQITLRENSNLGKEIFNNALYLFEKNCNFKIPYRSIGVSVSNLSFTKEVSEIPLFDDCLDYIKEQKKELALEDIRRRFGYHSIGSLRLFDDTDLSDFNPKAENTIYPRSYFK